MLQTLIERYGNNKTEMDSYKKQVEEDNKAIKEIMTSTNIREAVGGKFVAKLSESVSESFDEERLLATLHVLGVTDCIKTKEYVDMSILEDLIYNGKVNAAELASCKITKVTPRLTISKVKEKK